MRFTFDIYIVHCIKAKGNILKKKRQTEKKESANEQERERERETEELLEISEQRRHSRAKWSTNSTFLCSPTREDYKMQHDDCYLCILSCTRDI